jgi:AmmeMemoRadiSam system protein B
MMNFSSAAFKVRKPSLPPGWYPQPPEKILSFLEKFAPAGGAGNGGGKAGGVRNGGGFGAPAAGTPIAAAAPHAGWYYSGAIAAMAVAALAGGPDPGTVALIGGHLPGGAPPLFAPEDAVDTPLGVMEIDGELREALYGSLRTSEDRYRDNTVEVLLPMVKYFFPQARLLWMRLPAELSSFEGGRALARAAASLDRKLLVLGSTDLTHYGPNYGFAPEGLGSRALDWVKTVNDRRFIDAVQGGDPALVLERAEGEKAACSAGAVLGVMGYAAEIRAASGPAESGGPANGGGECIAYGTSADAGPEEGPPDSFVGYGAFVWR